MTEIQKKRHAFVVAMSTKEFNALCERVRTGWGSFDELIDIAMGVKS